MVLVVRERAAGLAVCGFVLALCAGRSAVAQVKQTDAAQTPLPQPVGAAELDLVDQSWAWDPATLIDRDATGAPLDPPVTYGSYYAPPAYPQFTTGDAITLSGLFKWRGEALDPVRDASTGPGYFSAKCGFSGQIVLLGSNCQMKLGWYNVTDPSSQTPPSAAQIYPFVDAPAASLDCTQDDGVTPKTDGFCPLAWDNEGPRRLSTRRWTPKTFSAGDLSKDPRYLGGAIGFAAIGASSGACTQSKFSMYEYNQRNAQGVPWVTTLIYHSTVDPSGFYLAFEGQPMPAADWTSSGADGDFNDLVFYVSGVTCEGGNQPCDTGLLGACSVGRTGCSASGAAAACVPVARASAETCDDVDNDCNGVIDDGAGLCPNANEPNCFRGTCVASCKNGAFACPSGTSCDASGRCVDPACEVVSCAPGSTCQNGACVDGCADARCPHGQRCELGQCVNPCVGVACPDGRVCDQGSCVDRCDCAGCAAGLSCGADGRCVDSACANVGCPEGTACRAGACVDPCHDVVCPSHGLCFGGSCTAPSTGSAGSSGASAAGSSNGDAGKSNAGNGDAGDGGTGKGNAGNGDAGDGGAGDDSGGATFSGGAAGVDYGASGGSSAGRASSVGGATARGGTPSSAASAGAAAAGGAEASIPLVVPARSSSCGYALLGRGESRRAAPLFGLMLGAAWLRRRRTRKSSARLH